MEQGDLINLLENLLGPATAGVATPRQSGAYHDEAAALYLDADDAPSVSGGLQPSMTGLLSASMPIGIVIVEAASLRVVRINKILLRMLGVMAPVESMSGRPLPEVAPALAAPDLIAALRQVAVTGMVSSAILNDGSMTASGQPTYRRWTIGPLRQGARSFDTLVVSVLDVTEEVMTRRRMEEAVARAPASESSALSLLARDLTAGPAPAFDRAAQTIAEALGDVCGVFIANGDGRLMPVAFYHREPQIASQLTSFYTQHPLQSGEGLVGQVARQGTGAARASVSARDLSYVLPGVGEEAQALGILSAACAPLRGAPESTGAVLVLSTRRAAGGSDRAFDDDVLGALNLFAGVIALAARNARLALEISAADAQREAVFAGITDGVAIYDRFGRLRHINAVAEQLLTPPSGAQLSARPMLQGFLDERGASLAGDGLPWMRVLRGEGTPGAVERVIATWEGGAQRALVLKALPARDASGAVSHAVVILRPDPSPAANHAGVGSQGVPPAIPAPSALHSGAPEDHPGQPAANPSANTSEAGEICARVARAFGTANKRHIEARLPHRKIWLAASEPSLELAIASLVEAAAAAFPPSAPLQMSLVVEPAETATSRPRRYSAGPVPEFSGPAPGGREPAFVATIQLRGSQAGATLSAAAPYLEQARARAAAFGGMAWVYEESGQETLFLLRGPVASIGR
jgi:PAS domain-containing protein